MGIDLSNYVEVSERIEMFRAKYPEGTYVVEIVELPTAFADKFIAVRCAAYRAPDDLAPGIDMAWEPVPGKTPYTKDSELQNASTSAIGRAIIAVGAADAKRGVASREEVQNRQPEPRPRSGMKRTPTPQSNESHEDAPRTNGSPEVVTTTTALKRELLEAVNGDKAKASMIWRETVGNFGYTVEDQIPDDMKPAIGAALLDRVLT